MRVRASSLTFRDLAVLYGRFPGPHRPGLIPFCAGAGEVVAAGEGVARFTIGDRLMPTFFPSWLGGRLVRQSFSDVVSQRAVRN